MTLTIEYEQLMMILDNQRTAIDALIPIGEAAGSGDVYKTICEVPRAMELIQQSVKSTYSIINEIRSRHAIPTS